MRLMTLNIQLFAHKKGQGSTRNGRDSAGRRLGAKAAPIELPIGAENELRGVVDLVRMIALEFDGQQDENYKEVEIPAELQSQAEEYRANLIEAVADYDEELMMTYLDGK